MLQRLASEIQEQPTLEADQSAWPLWLTRLHELFIKFSHSSSLEREDTRLWSDVLSAWLALEKVTEYTTEEVRISLA
jgi:hypothetical protein